MKVGFVGAGKVGCSLGKHFTLFGVDVVGYYSRSIESAKDAANFTESNYFSNLETLIEESDVVFVTVPDDAIAGVWDRIKCMSIAGKYICHCSGSLSSRVFKGIEELGAYGFSIHPLLAVSDRYHSYKELPSTVFTIEGNSSTLPEFLDLLARYGLNLSEIDGDMRTRYHMAAVMASNLVVSLIQTASEEFEACGMDPRIVREGMAPLILNNVNKVLDVGAVGALTGPIERNDVQTVKNHLRVVDGVNRDIYVDLSRKAIEIAKVKHPESNYDELGGLLNSCGGRE